MGRFATMMSMLLVAGWPSVRAASPAIGTAPAPVGPSLTATAAGLQPPRWQPVTRGNSETPPPVRRINPQRTSTVAAPKWQPAAKLQPPVPVRSCGHAPDYTWLEGTLEFLHGRDCWTLRYAPLGEEDRYGGSVTLEEAGSLAGYQSGQLVHVTGGLVKPDSRQPSPAFRVTTMRPLGRP